MCCLPAVCTYCSVPPWLERSRSRVSRQVTRRHRRIGSRGFALSTTFACTPAEPPRFLPGSRPRPAPWWRPSAYHRLIALFQPCPVVFPSVKNTASSTPLPSVFVFSLGKATALEIKSAHWFKGDLLPSLSRRVFGSSPPPHPSIIIETCMKGKCSSSNRHGSNGDPAFV